MGISSKGNAMDPNCMSDPGNLLVTLEIERPTNSTEEAAFSPLLMFAVRQAANANTPCIQEGCGWLLEQYVHSCKK